MVAEVVAILDPKPWGRYLDGTVGGGGHAAAILQAGAPTGWLYGCDRDAQAIEAASRHLAAYAGRFELRRLNFADVGVWLSRSSCEGILLDLGVSSPQLNEAERGFTFQADGPLDMRMDRSQGLTAAQWIKEADVSEMAKVFWELGDEREAWRLARAIDAERRRAAISSTGQLARLIERVVHRSGGHRLHPATKVFQAVRMVVNDELGSLRRGLDACWNVLKPGGRLVTITFHSGEDRVVKDFGKKWARDYDVPGEVDIPELRKSRAPRLRWLQKKPQEPSASEVRANPRARSARLRAFEKLAYEES
jgi:16S rRNA (cytosine1402-N4)-methyltransferase